MKNEKFPQTIYLDGKNNGSSWTKFGYFNKKKDVDYYYY